MELTAKDLVKIVKNSLVMESKLGITKSTTYEYINKLRNLDNNSYQKILDDAKKEFDKADIINDKRNNIISTIIKLSNAELLHKNVDALSSKSVSVKTLLQKITKFFKTTQDITVLAVIVKTLINIDANAYHKYVENLYDKLEKTNKQYIKYEYAKRYLEHLRPVSGGGLPALIGSSMSRFIPGTGSNIRSNALKFGKKLEKNHSKYNIDINFLKKLNIAIQNSRKNADIFIDKEYPSIDDSKKINREELQHFINTLLHERASSNENNSQLNDYIDNLYYIVTAKRMTVNAYADNMREQEKQKKYGKKALTREEEIEEALNSDDSDMSGIVSSVVFTPEHMNGTEKLPEINVKNIP